MQSLHQPVIYTDSKCPCMLTACFMIAQLHGQSVGCMKVLCELLFAAQRVLQVQRLGLAL